MKTSSWLLCDLTRCRCDARPQSSSPGCPLLRLIIHCGHRFLSPCQSCPQAVHLRSLASSPSMPQVSARDIAHAVAFRAPGCPPEVSLLCPAPGKPITAPLMPSYSVAISPQINFEVHFSAFSNTSKESTFLCHFILRSLEMFTC